MWRSQVPNGYHKAFIIPSTYTHTYIIIVHIHIHYISSLRVIFQWGHPHSISSLIWGKTAGIDSYQAAITQCLCLIQSFTLLFSDPSLNVHFLHFLGGGGGVYQGLISDHYTRVDKLSGFDVFILAMLFVHTEKTFLVLKDRKQTLFSLFPIHTTQHPSVMFAP